MILQILMMMFSSHAVDAVAPLPAAPTALELLKTVPLTADAANDVAKCPDGAPKGGFVAWQPALPLKTLPFPPKVLRTVRPSASPIRRSGP